MGSIVISPEQFGLYASMTPADLVKEWPFGDMPAPGVVSNLEVKRPLAAIPCKRPVRLLGRIASADRDRIIIVRRDFEEPLAIAAGPWNEFGAARLLRGVDIAASVTLESGYKRTAKLLGIFGIEQPDIPGYVQGVVTENTSTQKTARLRIQTGGGVLLKLIARDANLQTDPIVHDITRTTPAPGTFVRARVGQPLTLNNNPTVRGIGDIYTIG